MAEVSYIAVRRRRVARSLIKQASRLRRTRLVEDGPHKLIRPEDLALRKILESAATHLEKIAEKVTNHPFSSLH